MTTTTDTNGQGAASLDDKYHQYGRTGGPARLAVLEYLAKHPAGATFETLAAVIRQAVDHYVVDRRVLQVLMLMRADNKLAREGRSQGAGRAPIWLWYSPASRQAAMARGLWRPGLPQDTAGDDTTPTTDGTADQAAGAAAISHARGLSTDATPTA